MMQRFATYLTLTLLFPTLGIANGDELQEILAKHYAARGGLENLEAIRAMQYSGVVLKHSDKINFTYTIQGDRCRVDYEFGGKQLIRLFDGRRGWQINPLICSDPQPLTRQEEGKMQSMVNDMAGPLVGWKDKNHRLRYHGIETLGDMQLYKIQVTKNRGHQETIFLDTETFLERLVIRTIPGMPPQFLAIVGYENLDGLIFVKEMISCSDLDCCLASFKANDACKKGRVIRFDLRKVNPEVEESFFVLGAAHQKNNLP